MRATSIGGTTGGERGVTKMSVPLLVSSHHTDLPLAFETAAKGGRGDLVIIIGAGSELGEVREVRQVRSATVTQGDYHGNFTSESFYDWFSALMKLLHDEYGSDKKFAFVLGTFSSVPAPP